MLCHIDIITIVTSRIMKTTKGYYRHKRRDTLECALFVLYVSPDKLDYLHAAPHHSIDDSHALICVSRLFSASGV